jgi:hypothetical protein
MTGDIIYGFFSAKNFGGQTKVFMRRIERYARKSRKDHYRKLVIN